MKPITEKQKDLMNLMLNEWAFKEFILSYHQNELLNKLYHGKSNGMIHPRTKVDEYTDEEANEMNEVRNLWIRYHKKEFDHKLPGQWKTKQAKYSKKTLDNIK